MQKILFTKNAVIVTFICRFKKISYYLACKGLFLSRMPQKDLITTFKLLPLFYSFPQIFPTSFFSECVFCFCLKWNVKY